MGNYVEIEFFAEQSGILSSFSVMERKGENTLSILETLPNRYVSKYISYTLDYMFHQITHRGHGNFTSYFNPFSKL